MDYANSSDEDVGQRQTYVQLLQRVQELEEQRQQHEGQEDDEHGEEELPEEDAEEGEDQELEEEQEEPSAGRAKAKGKGARKRATSPPAEEDEAVEEEEQQEPAKKKKKGGQQQQQEQQPQQQQKQVPRSKAAHAAAASPAKRTAAKAPMQTPGGVPEGTSRKTLRKASGGATEANPETVRRPAKTSGAPPASSRKDNLGWFNAERKRAIADLGLSFGCTFDLDSEEAKGQALDVGKAPGNLGQLTQHYQGLYGPDLEGMSARELAMAIVRVKKVSNAQVPNECLFNRIFSA